MMSEKLFAKSEVASGDALFSEKRWQLPYTPTKDLTPALAGAF